MFSMIPTELYNTSSRLCERRIVSAGQPTFRVVQGKQVVDDPFVLTQVSDHSEALHQDSLVVRSQYQVANGSQQVQPQLAKLEVVRQNLGTFEIKNVAQKPEQSVEK